MNLSIVLRTEFDFNVVDQLITFYEECVAHSLRQGAVPLKHVVHDGVYEMACQ